jgi:hypothetical protein
MLCSNHCQLEPNRFVKGAVAGPNLFRREADPEPQAGRLMGRHGCRSGASPVEATRPWRLGRADA